MDYEYSDVVDPWAEAPVTSPAAPDPWGSMTCPPPLESSPQESAGATPQVGPFAFPSIYSVGAGNVW